MKNGDMRVWWIPQVPGKPFHVNVADVNQAKFVLETLARYDSFQYKHRIKSDYCNAGGLEYFDPEAVDDSSVEDGWWEWADDEGNDVNELLQNAPRRVSNSR